MHTNAYILVVRKCCLLLGNRIIFSSDDKESALQKYKHFTALLKYI